MKKLDRLLAFLAYCRRIMRQCANPKNLKHIHLIFYGFTPNKGIYYDFKNHHYKKYVTDVKRYLNNTFINYNYKDLLRDKYSHYIFLKQFTSHIVPVYGLVDKGRCHLLPPFGSFEELFNKDGKFILKPRKSWGGKGVALIEVKNNELYLDGKNVERYDELFKGFNDYILVPFVYQHEYAQKINPQALNTIRLITCIWQDQVEVIGACQRFGSKTTGNVDNFSKGGISAQVDTETGIINSAYAFNPEKYCKYQAKDHPDTQEKIIGLPIPHWHLMLNEIIELHNHFKYLTYIAWDIAITPDDFKIIEVNDVSDVDGFQIHGPLMSNELNTRFYSST